MPSTDELILNRSVVEHDDIINDIANVKIMLFMNVFIMFDLISKMSSFCDTGFLCEEKSGSLIVNQRTVHIGIVDIMRID